MKVKDLMSKLEIPNLKPRDPNQAVMASKRNAGGPMRDKKHELKRGNEKHKGRAYEAVAEAKREAMPPRGERLAEASLGSRVEYDDFKAWFADLPNGASTDIDASTANTTARAVSKDFEGVCGKFDAKKNTGWIYEHYLKKSNLK